MLGDNKASISEAELIFSMYMAINVYSNPPLYAFCG
jgi:hypothetical protein